MRIALIGAGALGGEHYYNLTEALIDGRISEIILCDTEPSYKPVNSKECEYCRIPPEGFRSLTLTERIQAFHHIHKHRCKSFPAFYEDIENMLKSESVDGVIIGTPNHLHEQMAAATLTRGIPTLCEKPLGRTMPEVKRILQASDQNNTLLQVGLNFRWRKLYHFVRDKLNAGEIGDVKLAWGREFRGDWNANPSTKVDDSAVPSANWRFSRKYSGGSIIEKLCHDLDLFQWLINSPPSFVTAMGGTDFFDQQHRDTIDNAFFIVQYENCARLNYEFCLAAPYHGRFRERYFGIIGTKGMLDIDDHAGSVLQYSTDNTDSVAEFKDIDPPTKPGHHKGNSSVHALDEFLDRIEKGCTKAKFDPREVLTSTALALAIQQSISQSGQPINVQRVFDA